MPQVHGGLVMGPSGGMAVRRVRFGVCPQTNYGGMMDCCIFKARAGVPRRLLTAGIVWWWLGLASGHLPN